MDVINNPEDDAEGTWPCRSPASCGSSVTTSCWTPPKYFRLTPVRRSGFRNAFFVTATDVVLDDDGNVVEVLATYDPESRGGGPD